MSCVFFGRIAFWRVGKIKPALSRVHPGLFFIEFHFILEIDVFVNFHFFIDLKVAVFFVDNLDSLLDDPVFFKHRAALIFMENRECARGKTDIADP